MTEYPYPPNAVNVLSGIDTHDFVHLSANVREALTTILARVAERSYRRGFQQGATIHQNRPEDLPVDLHGWRYGFSTDLSPWADSPMQETSVERLFTENPALQRLGFYDPFERKAGWLPIGDTNLEAIDRQIVVGWRFSMAGVGSWWEVSTDAQIDCATHYCALPEPPPVAG